MKARFSCTGCGLCCAFPPGETLIIQPSEVARFIHKFPMYVRMAFWNYDLVVEALKRGGGRHRAVTDFIEQNYAILDVPNAPNAKKIMFKAEINALPGPGDKCHSLKDSSCSIYQERPLICRLFPVVTDQPLSMLGKSTFSMLRVLVNARGYKCHIGSDAPVIAEDGVVPQETLNMLSQLWSESRDLTSKMVNYPNFIRIRNEAARDLQHEVTREWRYSIAPVIDSYFHEHAEEMLSAQKTVLESISFNDELRKKMVDGYLMEYADLLN